MMTFPGLLAGIAATLGIFSVSLAWLGGDSALVGFALTLGIVLLLVALFLPLLLSRKTCPQCTRRVMQRALNCKHCGHEFDPRRS